jgi:hypothetical protein
VGASCGDTGTPVNPGGVVPQITSIAPSPIVASVLPQTITVTGNQFVDGLRLRVTLPDGLVTTVQGDGIQTVEATSFDAMLLLELPGTYTFVVENDNGTRSEAFAAAVQAGGTSQPQIASVLPSSLPRSALETIVVLQGTQLGSVVAISVTDPAGAAAVVDGSLIRVRTSSRLEFPFVFSANGIYTIVARGGGGDVSNPVTITVN